MYEATCNSKVKPYSLLRAYNHFVLERIRANPAGSARDMAVDAIYAVVGGKLPKPQTNVPSEIAKTLQRLSSRGVIAYNRNTREWSVAQ